MGRIVVKGLVLIATLLLVCGGWVLAADQETERDEWTLEECIRWSLENHPELVIYQYDLQAAQWELEKVQLEDQRRISKHDLEGKQEAVGQAEEAIRRKEQELALDVRAKYFQVLRGIQTLAGAQRQLAWVDKQYQILQIKYESGLIPEKDWLAMQQKQNQMQTDYEDAIFRLETQQMELNLAMGRELELLIWPQDEEFSYETVELELADSIASALEKNQGIVDRRQAVQVAQDELELHQLLQVAQLELSRLEHVLEKAKYQLQQAEDQLVIQVRKSYLGLQNQEGSVEDGSSELEQARKNLQVLQVKYDAGMVSLLDLLDGQSALADAETRWIQKIYDYNLAKSSFLQLIGQEDGIQEYIRAD